MIPNKKHLVALAAIVAFSAPVSSSALETIFHQDFESGLGAQESISTNARFVSCNIVGDCPFSVHRNSANTRVRNFNVHHRSTNPYVGGSPLSGQVLGTVRANYRSNRDSTYTIADIDLDNLDDIAALEFDFDSWIPDDGDKFTVDVNGTLLQPTADSDLQYNADIDGFSGWDENGDSIAMSGSAIFDLSAYAGLSDLSLNFNFTSNGSGQEEGINLDDIKVLTACSSANGCTPPAGGNEVPAPATLALAAFGLAFARRRVKS